MSGFQKYNLPENEGDGTSQRLLLVGDTYNPRINVARDTIESVEASMGRVESEGIVINQNSERQTLRNT